MKLSNNTVLITGGGSGIGLELAKKFLIEHNTVIISGKKHEKLEAAKRKFPSLKTIVCDVSNKEEVKNMIKTISIEYPELNVLVNNAGQMHLHDVKKGSLDLQHQENEVMTNFFGVVSLSDTLLPILLKQKEASIINISSGLAYMPFLAAPVYTATKAAVHSYSQSMRQALEGTSVKIFEVLAPMTDTEMTKGLEMTGMKKISVDKLTESIMHNLSIDKFEIRPGHSYFMIKMYKLMPFMIHIMMKKMAPPMLKNLPRYSLE